MKIASLQFLRGFAPAISAVLLGLAWQGSALAGVEEGQAKSQVCVACHGASGNSAIPSIPSLSGQPKQFIVSALYQFREGKRVNSQMSPFAASLSNSDMNDLAAYFSSQPINRETPKANPASVAEGQRLSAQNNCVACHTASLMGQQHIPRLAGQHREYLRDQLRSFKASTRGEMDGVMTSAAQGLSEQDIETLADYLSTLKPAP